MEGKSMVAGIMERDGDARRDVEEGRDRATLHSFIRRYLADVAGAVYTDDWSVYDGIEDEDTAHEVVNHSDAESVRGGINTNGVAGLWSLLQWSIFGASVKTSCAYLDELEWRFNNQENEYVFREHASAVGRGHAIAFPFSDGRLSRISSCEDCHNVERGQRRARSNTYW